MERQRINDKTVTLNSKDYVLVVDDVNEPEINTPARSISGTTASLKATTTEIITGGKGNDELWGDPYVDTTFVYAKGDGHDIINRFGDDTLTLSKITFKENIGAYNDGTLVLRFDNQHKQKSLHCQRKRLKQIKNLRGKNISGSRKALDCIFLYSDICFVFFYSEHSFSEKIFSRLKSASIFDKDKPLEYN